METPRLVHTYGTANSVGAQLIAHKRYRTVQQHVGDVIKEEFVESVDGEWIKSKNSRLASKAATQPESDATPPFSSLGPSGSSGRLGYDSQLSAERLSITCKEKAFNLGVYVVRNVTCRFKIATFRTFYDAKWHVRVIPGESRRPTHQQDMRHPSDIAVSLSFCRQYVEPPPDWR